MTGERGETDGERWGVMRMLMLMVAIVGLIAGTLFWWGAWSYTLFVPSPEVSELGPAARCAWIGRHPVSCVYDATRGTIDLQYYQRTIDELDTYHDDEYRKRSL